MAFENLPEFASMNPREEEIEAVRVLISDRGLAEPLWAETATELLNDVRLNRAKAEYDALKQLQAKARVGTQGNPKVDRVYKPYLFIVFLVLFIYVLMRILGKA